MSILRRTLDLEDKGDQKNDWQIHSRPHLYMFLQVVEPGR